jgi:Zn-dependent alcohol dehydrogenase
MAPDLVRLHGLDGEAVGAYSGIGTFGEHQIVAASAAIKVDPRTPPEIAALIGCAVTTGIGAVRNTARVQAGESVVVIGLGGLASAPSWGRWPRVRTR